MSTLSMPTNIITRCVNEHRWDEARMFLTQNSSYSSCEVFSSHKDWKYFLVREKDGLVRYTMHNGSLVKTEKY